MIVIAPENLLPVGVDTSAAVGEAWKSAHRMLRGALANPTITTVMVTVGCPGSGKSTWLAEQPDLEHVAAFDAVWADVARRRAMAKRIADAGREGLAVCVHTPIDTCIARNAARPPARRVPEAFLRRAWADLQRFPVDVAEGWADVWHVAGTHVRLDRETSEGRDRAAGRVFYRWRTSEDERVRPEHAARHGRIFSWVYPPAGGHPGEDYGCRCWAELVRNDDVVEDASGRLRARPLTVPRWARRR